MFVNFSNVPSVRWDETEKAKAEEYGEVADFPFPRLESDSTSEEIDFLAKISVRNILQKKPDIVLVQGDFVLTYRIVKMLREKGIRVVAPVNEMVRKEEVRGGKKMLSTSFRFVCFRDYE